MRRTTLGLVGLLSITSIASAADLPVRAPAPAAVVAPVYSWTGFYIGGHVGGLWTKADARLDPLPDVLTFGTFANSGDVDDSAFVGGLHAGYNWQFAPLWVAGIEVDWSWTGAEGSFSDIWTRIPQHVTPGPAPGSLTQMSLGLDWLATVRGRIGYLVAPSTLLYLTGGAAWADVSLTGRAHNEDSSYAAKASLSNTASGYVLGAGVEWALGNNWMLRTEYLFYHLNTSDAVSARNTGTGDFPAPLGSKFSWSDTDVHTLRVGATYKF